MDNRLQFNKEEHLYTLDGKPITGVTSILQWIAKPQLINWAANMAVDYLQSCVSAKQRFGISPEEFQQWCKEARGAHNRKRDKAGDVGTAVHKECENFIRTQHLKLLVKENEEYNKLTDDEKIMADKMIDNFKRWSIKNKVIFKASEQQVYSERYWFSGTFDFVVEINGKTYLGDIKTSNGIYPEMWAQCAAYRICCEEMNPDIKFDGSLIVNLIKDGRIKVEINTGYQNFKNVFMGALLLHKGLGRLEKKKKTYKKGREIKVARI